MWDKVQLVVFCRKNKIGEIILGTKLETPNAMHQILQLKHTMVVLYITSVRSSVHRKICRSIDRKNRRDRKTDDAQKYRF